MNGPLSSSVTDKSQAANRKRSTLVDQMPASKKVKLESEDQGEYEDDDRPEEDIKLEVRLSYSLLLLHE